jgi:DNA modification methylase
LVAALKSEPIPVAALLGMAAPYNPRRIDPAQLAALGRSLRTFGAVEPVVANRRSGRIVGGHQRVKAAEAEGIETLPVVWVDLDETGEKQLNLALNRISGEWDEPALAALLQELGSTELDLTGFGSAEVDELIARMNREARQADPDEVPEPPKVAVTKPGDLYVLGKHRLLCGDSTKAADVARVMAGEKAALMNTDPPYGIAYVANAKSKQQARDFGDIANDELDGAKLQTFLENTIRTAVPHLTETCAFYLWHPMLTQGTFFAAAAADILIHRQIIWEKPSLVFGRGDYHWRHELCFYGWRRGHRPPFYGERNQTTIWAAGREKDGNHPTQKPVLLFAVPLENHTKAGEIAFEPFAGSGSQIIAAEQTGRRCFGLEIDPIYCDVICARWEKFTGEKAVLEKAAA